MLNKQHISLERANELKVLIADYRQAEPGIPTGFRVLERTKKQQQTILQQLNATPADWENWRWQMRQRIKTADMLARFLPLSHEEVVELRIISRSVRWAISPYYLSLMDWDNYQECPIFLQSVPSMREIQEQDGDLDPMCEGQTSPVPGITRRYPDRLIINVTNQCAMFCRHCQRRRNFGEEDRHTSRQQLEGALAYIRENPEIRDVLITGGDALMLSDQTLDWLLTELDLIEHVEIKRIGTRVPVTLPQRITPELCAILRQHPPLYSNTQFNSPLEVTPEARSACDRLVESGIIMGNQCVLLRGINDDVHIMKKLNQELLRIRVRPYYLFHAKEVRGTTHFITEVETGLEIMEQLRGYTSGLAIPTYIINAPGGLGKTPLLPQYLLALEEEELTIRTWEKKVLTYKNHRSEAKKIRDAIPY